MNTRTTILRSLVVCIALGSVACGTTKGAGLGGEVPGSGNVQTETRDTAAFEAVAFEYPADIVIQQGEKDTVVIEAEDNLVPQLSTDVTIGIHCVESDDGLAMYTSAMAPSTSAQPKSLLTRTHTS